ncbi:Gfo/Idh/MocA family protein [Reinekea sp.]|jgi:predicted dehydrogenase|uniref:Gfo/Idh/MocA family protein n=1 Tax=Reinekea sp. TaxID=1970455 RepID=UPI0039894611
MSKKLKLGMVGGGEGAFIGAVHRIASRIDDRYELVAGALSSDAVRAKRSALALGIDETRSYASFEEMAKAEAAREDGIDAVSIVTPNHMHFPVAKAFLEQGIHVICDKPVTIDLAQALELKKIVAESGKIFALTHNYTGYPLVRQARKMVADGLLGDIRLVQSEYIQDWLTDAQEQTDNKQAQWRTDPEKAGAGGSLGDIGTHAFNLASFISGLDVTEVSAELTAFVPGRVLDDNAHVMLRYANGAKGLLWSSQVAPGNENGLKVRIYGDKGGLEWAQENPNELWFSPFGEPVQKLTRAGHGVGEVANRVSRTPAGHPEGYLEGFANLYSDVADAILAHNENLPAPEFSNHIPGIAAGIAGMEFIEKVVQSSRDNGVWTSLDGHK